LLYRLDRVLQEASLERMSIADFGYTPHQELFSLVRMSLEQDVDDPDSYLRINLPASLEGLAEELKTLPGELDPVDDRLLEDLFRTVKKIRRLITLEKNNQDKYMQEDAQKSGDKTSADYYREQVQQNSVLLRGLDQARIKPNGQHKEGQ